MKLFRALSSYLVLFVLVAVLAYGYYNRAELFPKYFSPVEVASDEAAPADAKPATTEQTAAEAAAPAQPAESERAASLPPVQPGPNRYQFRPGMPPRPGMMQRPMPGQPMQPPAADAESAPAEQTQPQMAQRPPMMHPGMMMPRGMMQQPMQPPAADAESAPTEQTQPQMAQRPPMMHPGMMMPRGMMQQPMQPPAAEGSAEEKSAGQPAQAPVPMMAPHMMPRPPMQRPQPPAAAATAEGAPERPMNPVMQARQAYWQRQFEEAEKHYKSLAEAEPDNPNPYGELGNIYYSQGKWQEAGQAYYEASVRLLKMGHNGRVVYMQRIIQGLDKDSADKLAQKIAEAQKQ